MNARQVAPVQQIAYWDAVCVVVSPLTTIASAIRDMAVSAYRGAMIPNLYHFFQNKEITKKATYDLLRRVGWKILTYAAVPFFYYSLVWSNLNELHWLLSLSIKIPVFLYMFRLYIRRTIEFSIYNSLLPKAIQQDENHDRNIKYMRLVLDSILSSCASHLSRSPQQFADLFFKKMAKEMKEIDFGKWSLDSFRMNLAEKLDLILCSCFAEKHVKVSPLFAKEIAPLLADIICDLFTALNSKELEQENNFRKKVGEKYKLKFENFFKSIGILEEKAVALAAHVSNQMIERYEDLKKRMPRDPYYATIMPSTEASIRSAVQRVFYSGPNTVIQCGISGLSMILPYFVPETQIPLVISELVVNSYFNGQSFYEYQLAESGVSAEDQYRFFANRNAQIFGMGLAQSVVMLLMAWMLRAYNAEGYFTLNAVNKIMLHFHLMALYLNKKKLPKENTLFDPLVKVRNKINLKMDETQHRFQSKANGIGDDAARAQIIAMIKEVVTSKKLTQGIAFFLTDNHYGMKYFYYSPEEAKNANLLTVVSRAPIVNLLLEDHAISGANKVEEIANAYDDYLRWVMRLLHGATKVLSSPIIRYNPLFYLVGCYVSREVLYKVASFTAFASQLAQEDGFHNLLLQLSKELKGLVKLPEDAFTKPIVRTISVVPKPQGDEKRLAISHEQKAEEKRDVVELKPQEPEPIILPRQEAEKKAEEKENRMLSADEERELALTEAIETELPVPNKNPVARVSAMSVLAVRPKVIPVGSHQAAPVVCENKDDDWDDVSAEVQASSSVTSVALSRPSSGMGRQLKSAITGLFSQAAATPPARVSARLIS